MQHWYDYYQFEKLVFQVLLILGPTEFSGFNYVNSNTIGFLLLGMAYLLDYQMHSHGFYYSCIGFDRCSWNQIFLYFAIVEYCGRKKVPEQESCLSSWRCSLQ